MLETPKAACPRGKTTLQALCGLPLPKHSNQIHYRAPDHPEIRRWVGNAVDAGPELEAHLATGRLHVFAFVRHPATRLVSAYRDKILRSEGPFWEGYRQQIRAHAGLAEGAGIALEHFVDWIADTPDDRRDIHWRSQVALLCPDIVPYGRIGRLERFATDFSEILKAIDPEGDGKIQHWNATAV